MKIIWRETFLLRMFLLGLVVFNVIILYGMPVIEWMNNTLKHWGF